MDKTKLLDAALAAVCERGDAYGAAGRNLQNIADRWTLHMRQRHGDLSAVFTPQDVAMLMIETKLARLAHSPNHEDSLVDIAGYAACYADVMGEEL